MGWRWKRLQRKQLLPRCTLQAHTDSSRGSRGAESRQNGHKRFLTEYFLFQSEDKDRKGLGRGARWQSVKFPPVFILGSQPTSSSSQELLSK
ncbi:hypothetical protein CesoFtcFv8_022233 [Champsocephalus esox]|uniref:Uncharacterized protein n=1 Tax=Champsocephalus esox TaxID=159716 RepID=A0AAN8GJL4_9TELE|nr:hypothetical protein CesoFtcFv8_022233 [Champsocephalus esox]